MGMSHENQKHRSRHFCEAHFNQEEEDEKEEFWGDEPDLGDPLASSHYVKNTLLDLPSPLLHWLQDLGGGRGQQKENEDPVKETAIKFVDPSLPLPVSSGSDVLGLMMGQATEKAKEMVQGTGSDTSNGTVNTFDVSHSPIMRSI
jgi:hypothetical protein